jgi:hypothetical protein
MSQHDARKADTYQKIQLGGLVIKAGLKGEEAAIVLGALVEARRSLDADPQARSRYKALGDAVFASAQGRS